MAQRPLIPGDMAIVHSYAMLTPMHKITETGYAGTYVANRKLVATVLCKTNRMTEADDLSDRQFTGFFNSLGVVTNVLVILYDGMLYYVPEQQLTLVKED